MATMSDARPRERSACWASNLERRTVLNRGRYHFIQKCYRIDSCAEDVRDRHSLFCCSADFANCFYVFKFQYLRGTEMAGRAKKNNIWLFHPCRWSETKHSHDTHTWTLLPTHFSRSISPAKRVEFTLLSREHWTRNYVCLRIGGVCLCQTQTLEYHSIKSKRCENNASKNIISGWLLHLSWENWMWCGAKKFFASYLIRRQELCAQFSVRTQCCRRLDGGNSKQWPYGYIFRQPVAAAAADIAINNNCMLTEFWRKNSHAPNRNTLELLLFLALNVIVVVSFFCARRWSVEGLQVAQRERREKFPIIVELCAADFPI